MTTPALITDPTIQGYRYTLVHPETLDTDFKGIVSFNPFEIFFLRNRFLNLIYFGGNPELEARTPQRPYVLLGPYGDRNFNSSDELRVLRKSGEFVHMSHWHPSCESISLERLVCRVEGDILDCARDFCEVPKIDVMVLDPLWKEVAGELKNRYQHAEFRYSNPTFSLF
ncbi:MAG: hypothetical protein WCV90_08525 [Candidatus Woesearchaeota archaeon]|jgi:hypothetical protein